MDIVIPTKERTSQKSEIDLPHSTPTDNGRPPLHSGDRLTRTEFERRYQAHPEIQKAELIEGVVYVSSPIYVRHGAPHGDIMAWLGVYRAATMRVHVFDNTSLRLDIDNEPQPDACVWVEQEDITIEQLDQDDFLEIKPLLIVEVASSSVAYDLHDKLHVYRRNGIAEYLVLLTHERAVRWFVWRAGEYNQLQPDADGILRSRVLPGLWLDPVRFWQGDLAGVLAVLQQGLASSEHSAFVQALQQRTTPSP